MGLRHIKDGSSSRPFASDVKEYIRMTLPPEALT